MDNLHFKRIAEKCGISDLDTKITVPTFLHILISKLNRFYIEDDDNDIILVYKKLKCPIPDDNSRQNDHTLIPKTRKVSESGDLDLTGSPLECSLGLDSYSLLLNASVHVLPRPWRKEELNYGPLTPDESLAFLSQHNVDLCDNKLSEDRMVWTLVDGTVDPHTILQGCHVDDCNGWLTRSWVSLHECVSRSHADKDFYFLAVDRHKSFARLEDVAETEMKFEIMCVYDLCGSRNAGDDVDSARPVDDYASLVVEVAWQWESLTVRENVLTPSLDALTYMDLLIAVGSDTSVAYPLWQQITFLQQLKIIVEENREAVLPQMKLMTNESSMLGRVRELIKSSDDTLQHWSNRMQEEDTQFHSIIDNVTSTASKGRTHADFIHALWRLLMCCHTVEDLLSCWLKVFEEVKCGNLVPYIDPQNTCEVAVQLKALSIKNATVPEMTGLSALKMLYQIGVETLEKDFLFMLLASNVATFEHLRFTEYHNSCDKRMVWLCKMYTVIEFLLVTQCYLDLPLRQLYALSFQLVSLAHKNPKMYNNVERDATHRIRHCIRTVDAITHIENKAYSSWRLTVDSATKMKKVNTTVLLSTIPICPPTLCGPDVFSYDLDNLEDFVEEDLNLLYRAELKSVSNMLH